MQTLAALVPPVIMAVAFIAIARAALRHTDGSVRRGREADSPPAGDGSPTPPTPFP